MLVFACMAALAITGAAESQHESSVGNAAEEPRPADAERGTYAVRGILAFNATNSMVIPHQALPELREEKAAFTVMLAVMLVSVADGFRALFWKGQDNSHRTPSMWLTPNDTRVTFRVSNPGESWGTSRARLPVGEWCHIALVSRGDGLLQLYINGRLDTALALSAPPRGNSGPLWLGRDKSQPGMEGLLAELRFSNSAASAAEVMAEAAGVLPGGGGARALPAFWQLAQQQQQPDAPRPAEDGSPAALQLLGGSNGAGGDIAWGGAWGLSASDGARRGLLGSAGPVAGRMAEEDQAAHDRSAAEIERRMVAALERLRREEGERRAGAAVTTEGLREEEEASPVATGRPGGAAPQQCRPGDDGPGSCSAAADGAEPRGALDAAGTRGEAEQQQQEEEEEEGADEAARLHEAAVREERADEEHGDGGAAHDAALGRALRLHAQAAELGHAKSLAALGHMHAGGFGGLTPDEEAATFYYLQAAAHGDIEGLLAMAHRHIHGFGSVPMSCEAALHYGAQAARQAYEIYTSPGGQTRIENVKLHEGLRLQREDHKGKEDKENEYLETRASLGDGKAAASLGNRYYWGTHGLDQDHAAAFQMYEASRRAGTVGGTLGAGKMLLKGEGVAKDAGLAIDYLNKAADRGSAEALNGLGFMYFNGDQVEKDPAKALEYFERSADVGSTDGMFNAGMILYRGLGGVEKDLEAAVRYFSMGAHRGHFSSSFHLAEMTRRGEGVNRDCKAAYRWYEAVAQVGPWARSLKTGLKKFLAWRPHAAAWAYAQAAELGYRTATYNVAWLHRGALAEARQQTSDKEDPGGLSLRPDIRRAVLTASRYYERLVLEQRVGLEERRWAQIQLADGYYFGSSHGGVREDKELAAKLYHAAGQGGDAQGLFSAGMMYLTGDGVAVDLDLAHQLLMAAHEMRQAPVATYLGLAYTRALRVWNTAARPVWAALQAVSGSTGLNSKPRHEEQGQGEL